MCGAENGKAPVYNEFCTVWWRVAPVVQIAVEPTSMVISALELQFLTRVYMQHARLCVSETSEVSQGRPRHPLMPVAARHERPTPPAPMYATTNLPPRCDQAHASNIFHGDNRT